jgi:hypothetical protein
LMVCRAKMQVLCCWSSRSNDSRMRWSAQSWLSMFISSLFLSSCTQLESRWHWCAATLISSELTVHVHIAYIPPEHNSFHCHSYTVALISSELTKHVHVPSFSLHFLRIRIPVVINWYLVALIFLKLMKHPRFTSSSLHLHVQLESSGIDLLHCWSVQSWLNMFISPLCPSTCT